MLCQMSASFPRKIRRDWQRIYSQISEVRRWGRTIKNWLAEKRKLMQAPRK